MALKPKKIAPKPKRIRRPVSTPFPQEVTLKPKGRPAVTPFEEDKDYDPMVLARTVAKEYRAMENGHHERLRTFLGRAYLVYRLFQQLPETYQKLKDDPFWGSSRKPKGKLKTSKPVLLFLMRAETPNDRTRASKYAKILNGFARANVRADQVPGRIKTLGGVEAAYDYFLAEERGLQPVETEGRRPPIRRKVGLRAVRGANDDKVQGDVETESSSANSRRAAIGSRRYMPSFDPERHLLVELERGALDAILAAGSTQEGPVTLQLEITVHPRDAKGFVRVVGARDGEKPVALSMVPGCLRPSKESLVTDDSEIDFLPLD